MPSERQMWETLQPHMKRLGMDPVRVENPALPGTPDVNFIEGWAELKHADRWPHKGGPLRLGHPPTPEQKTWLMRRWMAGGSAWLVLRVGKEWFVFRGCDVAEVWREAPTQAEIQERCAFHFPSAAAVAEALKRGRHEH